MSRRLFAVSFLLFVCFALCFGLADSLNMHLVGSWTCPRPIYDLDTRDTFLFVAADDTFYMLSIKNPSSPMFLKKWARTFYRVGHDSTFLYVSDVVPYYSLVLSYMQGAGFTVLDSIPGIADWEIDNENNVAIAETPSDLAVIDISIPDAPEVRAHITPIGTTFNWYGYASHDTFAYFWGWSPGWDGIESYHYAEYCAYSIADLDSPRFLYRHDFRNDSLRLGTYRDAECWDGVANDNGFFVDIETHGDGVANTFYSEKCDSFDSIGSLVIRCLTSKCDYIFTYALTTGLNHALVWSISSCHYDTIAYYHHGLAHVTGARIRDTLYVVGEGGADRRIEIFRTSTTMQIGCQGSLDEKLRPLIYPNPSQCNGHIRINPKADGILFDINGRIAGRIKDGTADVSNLETGVYLVSINGYKSAQKLLVLR